MPASSTVLMTRSAKVGEAELLPVSRQERLELTAAGRVGNPQQVYDVIFPSREDENLGRAGARGVARQLAEHTEPFGPDKRGVRHRHHGRHLAHVEVDREALDERNPPRVGGTPAQPVAFELPMPEHFLNICLKSEHILPPCLHNSFFARKCFQLIQYPVRRRLSGLTGQDEKKPPAGPTERVDEPPVLYGRRAPARTVAPAPFVKARKPDANIALQVDDNLPYLLSACPECRHVVQARDQVAARGEDDAVFHHRGHGPIRGQGGHGNIPTVLALVGHATRVPVKQSPGLGTKADIQPASTLGGSPPARPIGHEAPPRT